MLAARRATLVPPTLVLRAGSFASVASNHATWSGSMYTSWQLPGASRKRTVERPTRIRPPSIATVAGTAPLSRTPASEAVATAPPRPTRTR